MTFGEKIKTLRKSKGMSQSELAALVGVSDRTLRSWEGQGRFPKQNSLYQKLADALQCDVAYLMSENAAFITEATEQFGNRGAKQAQLPLCLPVDLYLMRIKLHLWMRSRVFIWTPRNVQRNIHRKNI